MRLPRQPDDPGSLPTPAALGGFFTKGTTMNSSQIQGIIRWAITAAAGRTAQRLTRWPIGRAGNGVEPGRFRECRCGSPRFSHTPITLGHLTKNRLGGRGSLHGLIRSKA